MEVKKQQLELDMEQQTGSKLRKEYFKAIYYHPAYLTYIQSLSLSLVTKSCPTLSNPMDRRDSRLLRPWDFPGKCIHVVIDISPQILFPACDSSSLVFPMMNSA